MRVSDSKRLDDSPSLGSLKAFELIGRLGGIRKAAAALGVDHAAVSRHLKSLETWAGIPLLDRRRGENARLTLKGARYHSRISAALCEIDNACATLRQHWEAGVLGVWCSPALAYQWLMPRFQQFTDAYDDMQVNLRIIDCDPHIARAESSARIEFVADGSLKEPDTGLQAEEICRPTMIPVASPAFLAHAGELSSLSQVARLALLHEDTGDYWGRWLCGQGAVVSHTLGGTRLSHAHLTIDAAKRGQGVALAPELLVADEIDEGRLLELKVAGHALPHVGLGVFMLSARGDRWRSPAISRLRFWLMETMRFGQRRWQPA